MKPTKTWIVITDGARSRILLNTGAEKGVEEVSGTDFRAPHPKAREIMTDRHGSSFESADSSRHSYEPHTDPNTNSKVQFAKDLAKFLDLALVDEKFDRIIIAADPKSLGTIRSYLTSAVKDRVVGELAKDLTQIPDSEIASHFEKLINL